MSGKLILFKVLLCFDCLNVGKWDCISLGASILLREEILISKIKINLLGVPSVLYDNVQIVFPFRKAEALFYYMVVKKKVSRDSLVDFLWDSVDEETAKKNLRNTVYFIKKTFNKEILISPQRAIIVFNPDLDIEFDVDILLNSDGNDSIRAYGGEFLEGFFIKDAENFESWMIDLREEYKGIYINKLIKEVNRCNKEEDFENAELYCRELIKIDEFNEEAYRILMNIYRAELKYEKCIDVYNRLSELLKEELSIAPDNKTQQLFDEIIIEKSSKLDELRSREDEFFYGRSRELERLTRNYFGFMEGRTSKSMIIFGEAGVGKTRLMDKFLKSTCVEKCSIIRASCYHAEEAYMLKPWNEIFESIHSHVNKYNIKVPNVLQKIIQHVFPTFMPDFITSEVNPLEKIDYLKYQAVEKAVVDLFNIISSERKVIIVIDDIHWMDEMSLNLLKNVLFGNKNRSIMLLTTCRNEKNNKTEGFFTELGMRKLTDRIELDRLNKLETIEFSEKLIPEYKFNDDEKEFLYRETEGNIFFLVEFLNNLKEKGGFGEISQGIHNILSNRILNVSEEGKKILNIASVFFDRFSFKNIQEISEKNEMELLDILEELKYKYLLKELSDGKSEYFLFTHQKIREFTYLQLSLSKRRIIHCRIARNFESKLRNNKMDKILYSKLIYHFENGGEKKAALKYRIKNLYEYLQVNHEMFPICDDQIIIFNSTPISREQVSRDLDIINNMIEEVRLEEGDTEEIREFEILYLHMIGRNCIIQGNYKNGLVAIQSMIDKSLKLGDYQLALKGLRQVIYCGINTYNIELMEENIEKAAKIAKEQNCSEELCIIYRLKGLLRIMEGRYDEGEELLHHTIELLNKLDDRDKYILNIAASYNFIGESNRRRMDFKKALHYYDKAISICEERKIIIGLTVFYTNAGQAAYEMKRLDLAKVYFDKALNIYDRFDYLWRRSTSQAYSSLLAVKNEKYQEALELLKGADKSAVLIQNPYESGIVFRVKAEIRQLMDSNILVKSRFGDYLSEDVGFYSIKGIECFRNLNGCYEVEIFNNLLKCK